MAKIDNQENKQIKTKDDKKKVKINNNNNLPIKKGGKITHKDFISDGSMSLRSSNNQFNDQISFSTKHN